ncbi:hypothetical protein Hdeb2414_s0027g00694241 [Helianthus debilis subsp. tardiflorus]
MTKMPLHASHMTRFNRAGHGVGRGGPPARARYFGGHIIFRKNPICIRKNFFFNMMYLYKHQHRPNYKTILMF